MTFFMRESMRMLLWHGLVMAKNIGVAKIVVELDAKVVVNLITNMSKTKKSMKSIVMEYKNPPAVSTHCARI